MTEPTVFNRAPIQESADFSLDFEPTAQSKSYQDLEEEIRLLRAVIDNFPGGLTLFDKDLKMVFCSNKQKELLNYPPNLFEYGTPSLEQLFRFNAIRGEYGAGNIDKLVEERMNLARLKRAHVYERTRPNGVMLEIRGVPLEGGGFMTTHLDVTAQRKPAANPQPAASPPVMVEHDKLTGLPRGDFLRDRMGQILASITPGQVVAVHCMDLDHFKDVNARYGKPTGDALLQKVADRLRSIVREYDLVARIGGDRFVVLQPHVKRPSEVARLAHRILDAIREPISIGGNSIVLSSSIGLALAPRDGVEPDAVLAKAEAAVLGTKSRNRGGFEAETAEWGN